jgi:thiol-disulfide isomerase/thioredoxin
MVNTCFFVHQWWHLFLVCLLVLPRVTQARTYLFRDLPDGESAEPIIEHHNENETIDKDTDKKNVVMPEFLQQDAPYHRVILFYSPQCPHCIHFQPTYVEFARHFRNLTRQNMMYAGIDVKFFAISCISYSKICQRQKITKYPLMKAFPAREKHEHIISSADLHPMTVLKALGTTVVDDKWKLGKTDYGDTFRKLPRRKAQNDTSGSYFSLTRTQAQLYGDAYLTFYNAMKDSVFVQEGPLPTIRRQALRQFLTLLQKALPPWRLNWLVNYLLDDFNDLLGVQLVNSMNRHIRVAYGPSFISRLSGSSNTIVKSRNRSF